MPTDGDGRPVVAPAAGKKMLEQDASTIVFATTSPLLGGIGGLYLGDDDVSPLDDEPRQFTAGCILAEIESHSVDPMSAERS